MSKLKERWTRHFVDAASFEHPLRGDDLSFLLEGMEKNFPHLTRIQDLEAYTSYKQSQDYSLLRLLHAHTTLKNKVLTTH